MSIVVKALKPGYYGTRRRVGDTFPVAAEKDFSALWMAKVEVTEPVAEKAEEVVEEKPEAEPKPEKKRKKKQQ